jgi:hypothetical protein
MGDGEVGDFMHSVRRFFEVQDELKQIRETVATRAKPLRAELASTDAAVKSYMLSHGIDVCAYRGQRLQLSTAERPRPITRDAIAGALRSRLGEAAAEQCMAEIAAAAGTRRVATLRRSKAKAPPKRKAARAPALADAPAAAAAAPAAARVTELAPADLCPPSLDCDSD